MPKPIYLCSFSGGRTSAFMARFMQTHPTYAGKTVFVFANTGKEREETLRFIQECDTAWGLGVVWVEARFSQEGKKYKVVDYATASRNGEPFEAMMRHYHRIPGTNARACTTELKIAPIHAYMLDNFGKDYVKAIGIRSDELHRVNRKERRRIYPLVDDIQVTKGFIRDWWERQPFNLELKDFEGNCDLCFAKSVRKRMTLAKLYPGMADWWNRMEATYGNGHTFARESVAEVIERSKGHFKMATDSYQGAFQQTLFDPELDAEMGCFCKSTDEEVSHA